MIKRLLVWLRQRREQKKLALIAETASLVIQQRGATWSNRTCPNCTQAVSDTANFCQMCGHSFVQELQPTPEPAYQPYEIERHTSGIRPIVVSQEQQAARAQARALQPPDTRTGRFKAYKAQGDRPMTAWQKATKKDS